ncbi:HET-domain-containing protein [Hypoxylon fuscum]|nr:HET-domain-containing protein [Hypoxylon fuscum]
MATNPLICEICSKINFERRFDEADKLFTRTFPSGPLPFSPSYNTSKEEKEQAWNQEIADPTVLQVIDSEGLFNARESTCPVCNFFANIGSKIQYPLKTLQFVLCSSLRLCSPILNGGKLLSSIESGSPQPQYFDRGFLALDDHYRNKSNLYQHNFIPEDFFGGLACFRALPQDEESHVQTNDGILARIVPEWVDYKIPKGWLEFCKCHHTQICRRPDINNRLEGFQLLNCDSLEVESQPLATDYVALSYVWAASSSVPDDKHPNVILHAAEVTRQLGFQYLWVDRYCIDQGNNEEKETMIANMHLIFQQAEVTLVAVVDEFDGLQGVLLNDPSSQRGRKAQKKVRIGDMTLATYIEPKEAIELAKWSFRGWTFQEGLLSRRVLVFTDKQLYWNCCGMSEMEGLYIPPKISHLPDMSQQGRWMAPGFFDRASKGSIRSLPDSDAHISKDLTRVGEPTEQVLWKIFLEICDDIKKYSGRHLTYDSDSLNAFKGIMQMHMARAGDHIKFILGLPLVVTSSLDLGSCFAYILSVWSHDFIKGARRHQNHLPSWSWAGWAGPLWFETLYEYNDDSIVNPRVSKIYTPELRLIIGENGSTETSIQAALETTRSLDAFATLRVVKPYFIPKKNRYAEYNYFFESRISYDTEMEVLFTTENIKFVLTFLNQDNSGSYFLILKLTDKYRNGERLWERIGISFLDRWILNKWYRDLNSSASTNERKEFADRWKSAGRFEDFIGLLGLVSSETDILIA